MCTKRIVRNNVDAMRKEVRSASRPSERTERLMRRVSGMVTIALDRSAALHTIFLQLILKEHTR